MTDRLKEYLDHTFASYTELKSMEELKAELLQNLMEKMADLKSEGYEEETAFQMTIHSIGDLSELIEGINYNTRQVEKIATMDLSKSNFMKSDFSFVAVHDGKFNYSNLRDADFSDADLSDSTFKASNLKNVKFDRANLSRTRFIASNLEQATFDGSTLAGTDFTSSNLSGVSFDGMRLTEVVFDKTGLKGVTFRNTTLINVSFKTNFRKAIFDGATTDKLTYAVLKGYGAKLENVTVKA